MLVPFNISATADKAVKGGQMTMVQLSTPLTKGRKVSTNALASLIVLCIFQFAATTGVLIPFALLPLVSFFVRSVTDGKFGSKRLAMK
jgi:hypothetical protein